MIPLKLFEITGTEKKELSVTDVRGVLKGTLHMSKLFQFRFGTISNYKFPLEIEINATSKDGKKYNFRIEVPYEGSRGQILDFTRFEYGELLEQKLME